MRPWSDYFLSVISVAFEIYIWLIIARVLLSFLNPRKYHPLLDFIYRVTEPVLDFCGRILPLRGMGLDFSPLVAIIGLEVVRSLLIYLLSNLFRYLGG